MEKSHENVEAFGWAARDTSGVLSPFNFSRRHEVVGVVTEVGSKVEKFKIGDKVGVGCLVGSCRKCENCNNDLKNYCSDMILTYNGVDTDGTTTYGGYSDIILTNEHYVVHWPENLPIEAAPLLCARITTYSPLRYYGLDKPGMHIDVVGLGGLGHMAVKFAMAFGTKVTVISTSVRRKLVAGSAIGGMKETQETVDSAAKHNITPDVEVVPMDYVNTTLERLLKSDVKYRFVLGIGNTLNKS
uniref:Sinapyl alcohol dehydrogenase 2 n=1 Tax=Solanum tuberosum TaxID=4113 RepID=M1AKU2_SOLTU